MWFVGDVVAYQRDRLAWLTASRDRYGDVVRLAPHIVVVHDAELAHEVLVSTNDLYTVDNMLGSGRRQRALNEAHLQVWMPVRRDVWRTISDRITQRHIARAVSDLDEGLRRHAGRPIDLVAACRAVLGVAIVDFCLGGGADRAELRTVCTAADDLFLSALRALVNGEGRVAWSRRPAARAAMAANRRLLELLEHQVRRRWAQGAPDQPRDLLDGLIGGPASDAEVDRVVHVLRTIMFASHGVPGASFSWIALLLAEHREVAARVAAETAGSELARAAIDTGALPYTKATIKEALRLYPPQWLLTRSTATPVDIAGYRVAAGTEVLICPYLMHRHAGWWDAPDRFDPERWLRGDRPHARHAYIPFGAGPRICPGSLLGTVQLTVATALLARARQLDMPPMAAVRPGTDGLMLPVGVTGRWRMEGSSAAVQIRGTLDA
jgi:unspecific monooxygenase